MAGNVARRPDGRWRARYRDAKGKEHARQFDRKLDAVRWLASIEVARARGEWIDPVLARVRVGEWSVIWLAGQVQLKPSTRARHELAVNRHVLPAWENVRLWTCPTPTCASGWPSSRTLAWLRRPCVTRIGCSR
jgi:hypothetical protein